MKRISTEPPHGSFNIISKLFYPENGVMSSRKKPDKIVFSFQFSVLRGRKRACAVRFMEISHSSALSASISSGRVAQLVTKRTAKRPSGRGAQTLKAASFSRRSFCAFVRITNCWLVGESA